MSLYRFHCERQQLTHTQMHVLKTYAAPPATVFEEFQLLEAFIDCSPPLPCKDAQAHLRNMRNIAHVYITCTTREAKAVAVVLVVHEFEAFKMVMQETIDPEDAVVVDFVTDTILAIKPHDFYY